MRPRFFLSLGASHGAQWRYGPRVGQQTNGAVRPRSPHRRRSSHVAASSRRRGSARTPRLLPSRGSDANGGGRPGQERLLGSSVTQGTLWDRLYAQILYSYFNWRVDTFSDLQLILALNLLVLLGGGVIKAMMLPNGGSLSLWQDVYSVALASFGQSWPPANGPALPQFTAVATYVVGLVGFALLLALMEQSVLQVLDERVAQGSKVLEYGHVVVLLWGGSQADVKKLETVLTQLCAAYRPEGGRTLVVLSQREKLAMEALFARRLPPEARHGSRLVFRQGNPLSLGDLDLVSAGDAGAVVVLSDTSVTPDAADSQVMHCLVLMDEMEGRLRLAGAPRPEPGHVVAEFQDPEALPLLGFASTKPIIPMPTALANAGRLTYLLRRPAASELTDRLWDFTADVSIFVHTFPDLVGKSIGEAQRMLPDGIVIGLLERPTGYALINPPASMRVAADEDFLILRPTRKAQAEYLHLPAPVDVDVGNWSPADSGCGESKRLTLPRVGNSSWVAMADAGCSSLPREPATAQLPAFPANGGAAANGTGGAAEGAIVASSSGSSSSSAGTAASSNSSSSSAASRSRLLVPEWPSSTLTSSAGDALASFEVQELVGETRLASASSFLYALPTEYVPRGDEPQRVLVVGWGEQAFMTQLIRVMDKAPGNQSLALGSMVVFANTHEPGPSLQAALRGVCLQKIGVSHVQADPLKRSHLAAIDVASFDAIVILADAKWVDPKRDEASVAEVDVEADVLRLDALLLRAQLNVRSLLVERQAMAVQAAREAAAAAAAAAERAVLEEVLASLSEEDDGGGALGLSNLMSASASSLGSGEGALAAGGEGSGAGARARLRTPEEVFQEVFDSMPGPPSVAIVCQKLGNEAHTKFEDRARLPIGATVNLSSYSARLLAQLVACPRMVLPRSLQGLDVEPQMVDAGTYCAVGEEVSFWQLQVRAQMLQHVLLGYYLLPAAPEEPIQTFLCPTGADNRARKRVWNTGPQGRVKFLILVDIPGSPIACGKSKLWDGLVESVSTLNTAAVARGVVRLPVPPAVAAASDAVPAATAAAAGDDGGSCSVSVAASPPAAAPDAISLRNDGSLGAETELWTPLLPGFDTCAGGLIRMTWQVPPPAVNEPNPTWSLADSQQVVTEMQQEAVWRIGT